MMIMVTIDTLLSPLKIILSSRDLFPLFEKQFCKETPQIVFLSEHVVILGYLCIASTLPYSPLFCCIFVYYLLQSLILLQMVSSPTLTSSLGFPVSSLGHRNGWDRCYVWTLSPFASCCV